MGAYYLHFAGIKSSLTMSYVTILLLTGLIPGKIN